MIVGVKYCGGCNPSFLRKEIVENLKTDTDDGIIFEHFSENKAFDIILTINGCEKSCLSNTYINRNKLISISPPLNYDHILMLINKSYKSIL